MPLQNQALPTVNAGAKVGFCKLNTNMTLRFYQVLLNCLAVKCLW